jgi:DNA repair protein RadC
LPISDWPKNEQPREKMLLRGPDALSDAELLAIFLRTGVKGKTAVDLARELLTDFGGLRALLNADQQAFCQRKGLGVAKYVQLQASVEMAKRRLYESIERGDVLTSPVESRTYVTTRLRDLQHEVFACLFLDNAHRVIKFDQLFQGSINGASVHPREVVKQALACNAAAVILAHNHPSGNSQPSLADKDITKRLSDALGLVDIRVLDHLIIGDGPAFSFAERGLI